MSDLISRQDAINAIENTDAELTEKDWDELTDAINALPSADRPTGEWEEVEDYNGDIHYQCNQCKNEFILIDGTPQDNDYNYCPNCGARMKGGEEE